MPAASGVRAGTGLTPALEETAALERPLMMGAGGMGMASPSQTSLAAEAGAAGVLVPGGIAVPRARPRRRAILPRVRRHPYVRLALNGSFSALWVGQVISLFGDRVNQIALAAFVYEITDSPLAVALTFFVGTIPNLLFSPDRGRLRGPLGPEAGAGGLGHPAGGAGAAHPGGGADQRVAGLPAGLPHHDGLDLLPAGARLDPAAPGAGTRPALRQLGDVGGRDAGRRRELPDRRPVRGVPGAVAADGVLVRRRHLPRLGGAAGLDRGAAVRPARAQRGTVIAAEAGDWRATGTRTWAPTTARPPIDAPASIRTDLKAGWSFLRHEAVLLANTLQGTAGQFAVGIVTVSSIVLARQITNSAGDEYRATYAFMETSIGLGNLIGGFVLGAIATRVRKGPLVIAAYTAFGVLVFLVGIADSVPIVLGLLFGCRRGQHGLRHPQPDAVPGAHAAGADGARGEPAVRPGVRRDVGGDGGGRTPHQPCSARVP